MRGIKNSQKSSKFNNFNCFIIKYTQNIRQTHTQDKRTMIKSTESQTNSSCLQYQELSEMELEVAVGGKVEKEKRKTKKGLDKGRRRASIIFSEEGWNIFKSGW